MSINRSKLMEFFLLIGKLKTTKRAGWVENGVRQPESVADHMYRMAMLSFLAKDSSKPLNHERCIKIALVHDMAECIVGDITPADNVDKQEKHRREKEAMTHLCGLVSEDTASELYQLWQEYELQSSEEAKYVKDLDKFDMVLQAYEYETAEHRPGHLNDFFLSTQGKIQDPQVKQWDTELRKIRDNQNSHASTNSSQASGSTPGSSSVPNGTSDAARTMETPETISVPNGAVNEARTTHKPKTSVTEKHSSLETDTVTIGTRQPPDGST